MDLDQDVPLVAGEQVVINHNQVHWQKYLKMCDHLWAKNVRKYIFKIVDPRAKRPFTNPHYTQQEANADPTGTIRSGTPRPAGISSWVSFVDAYQASKSVRFTVDTRYAEVLLAHPEYYCGVYPTGHVRREFLDILNILCLDPDYKSATQLLFPPSAIPPRDADDLSRDHPLKMYRKDQHLAQPSSGPIPPSPKSGTAGATSSKSQPSKAPSTGKASTRSAAPKLVNAAKWKAKAGPQAPDPPPVDSRRAPPKPPAPRPQPPPVDPRGAPPKAAPPQPSPPPTPAAKSKVDPRGDKRPLSADESRRPLLTSGPNSSRMVLSTHDANRRRTDDTRSSVPRSSSYSQGHNDNPVDWSSFRRSHDPLPIGHDPRYRHQAPRADRHQEQGHRGRSPHQSDRDDARSRTRDDQPQQAIGGRWRPKTYHF